MPSDLSYSSDAPLTTREGDLFDRWPFAERVAHVLRNRREASSLVIGLYGTWGEGKTTLLNFIEEALEDAENVVVVRFNPWRFGNESALIRSFFDALATAVGGKLTTSKEDFASTIVKYAGAVSLGGFGVDIDPASAAQVHAEVDLEKLRDRLTTILHEADLRVVVRIDDIDRLDKDEVQAVFRLVKLSADFENVAYVLAFDPDVVAAALQERYGPGQPRAGYDFLEKIVTVPLQIPPARLQSLFNLSLAAIEEALSLSGLDISDDKYHFVNAFRLGLLPAMRTPRMAKRYGNAVRFALPILAGEVNVSDQLLIEGMRVMYPRLYDHVRSHPEIYLRNEPDSYIISRTKEGEDERLCSIEAVISERVTQHSVAASRLLNHLFPQVYDRGTNGDPRKDQRVASDWYFERFFNYAVPSDSIADRALAEAISIAESGDLPRCIEHLRSLLRESTEQRLVEMLHIRADSVPQVAIPTLSRAIASISDGLLAQHRFFHFSTENTAAAAVCSMIQRVDPPSRRDELVLDVLHKSVSITFGMQLRWWAVPDARGEGYLSEEADKTAIGIIADRIAALAVERPPHLGDVTEASWLYSAWARGHSKEEVASYLRDRLLSDPAEVKDLLFCLTSFGMTDGNPEPFPLDFGEKNYDDATSFVDPEDVMRAIKTFYPTEMIAGNNVNLRHVRRGIEGYGHLTIDEALACQFAFVHRQALTKGDNADPA